MNIQRCILHKLPYQYFCQKCFEPVCKDCTYLGPHNTQIHRISQISIAYQRRVNQIRDRIATVMDGFRTKILCFIDEQNHQIENFQNHSKAIESENSKYKSKILDELIKCYEHNAHEINALREQLQDELNDINDTGHQFESLKTDLEKVAEHEKIISAFKETIDKVGILLARKVDMVPLPKQQTDIRVAIKKIETLQTLYLQKLQTLSDIMKISQKQIKNYKPPTIPYQTLLKQLDENIKQNASHNVCHFCGISFSYENCNTDCKMNRLMMNVQSMKFEGYCSPNPQSARFGTHRHYFGKAKQQKKHYKNAQSSFKIHLEAICLKLQTLAVINKVKLSQQIKKNDKTGTGKCQRIVLQYCLIQLCKLDEDDAKILMKTCEAEPGTDLYQYGKLIEILEPFKVNI